MAVAKRPSAPKNSALSSIAMGGGPPATSASEEWAISNATKTFTAS